MRTNKRNDEFVKLFTKVDRGGIRTIISLMVEPDNERFITEAALRAADDEDGRGVVAGFYKRLMRHPERWVARARRALADGMIQKGRIEASSQPVGGRFLTDLIPELYYLSDRGHARVRELGYQHVGGGNGRGQGRWVTNQSLRYGQNELTKDWCRAGHLVDKGMLTYANTYGVKRFCSQKCLDEFTVRDAKYRAARIRRIEREDLARQLALPVPVVNNSLALT